MAVTREMLAELLDDWRAAQGQREADERGNARFVVEIQGVADEVLSEGVRVALALDFTIRPLFGSDDPDTSIYRLLEIPGIGSPDRIDLFDVADFLRTALGATTVEPDLGAAHYDWDGDVEMAQTESADFAFWCWAPDADKPHGLHWAIERIRLPQAWDVPDAAARRGGGIRVFQPDTGVVKHHRELPDKSWKNAGARNFVEIGMAPIDDLEGSNPGHGTATGSVVASPTNEGIWGAAPDAILVPLRALRSVAVFDQSRVAEAIDHARREGAHVITMSLGGVPSAALHAAVKAAVKANIILLAAAGNCVGEVVFPARYPEAIAVAGVNNARRPWRGSSRGPAVTISAPAEFVPCAEAREPNAPLRMNRTGQGTSFAVALVAGVAACWLAHYGRERLIDALPAGRTLQDQFRNLLRATAQEGDNLDPDEFGPGLVDAEALILVDPKQAFAPENDDWRPPSGHIVDLVAGLLTTLGGTEGLETAARVVSSDSQCVLELAALALDAARHGSTRRRALEGASRPGLSRALQESLLAARKG